MENCLGQWPDVFNKWWLHSRQNDSLMLQGEDRLLISLMIKMRLQETLCAAVRLINQLFPDMQYDRLINFYFSYHHLLKISSSVERKSSCLWAHSSMGFTCYSASSSPAPQGLANHFSLAFTAAFFYICLEWENQELSNDNSSYCTSGPVTFETSIFKLCELATNLALLATHFPKDLPQMSTEEQ